MDSILGWLGVGTAIAAGEFLFEILLFAALMAGIFVWQLCSIAWRAFRGEKGG